MRVQSIGQELRTNRQNNNRTNYQNNPTFQRDWSEHISWGANYVKDKGMTNFKLFSFPDAKAVFVEVAKNISEGMGSIKERVVQVIATAGAALTINNIESKDDKSKVYPMQHEGNGVYVANGIKAEPDDKYRYVVVDKNNNVNLVKDPYAKKQEDINGWSSIYDTNNYKWKNTDWL